jgi:DNA modification methylase
VENKILHGDSLDLLKDMDDNSVDSVVTDPPYGYSFMGKDWDKALPPIEIWKECVRVLKPGAFAFVMSAPRSDVHSRMCLMLEEAGFRIDFTPIAWTYATGFPKASNIGKMVDKRLGKERKVVGKRKVTPSDLGQSSGWNDLDTSSGEYNYTVAESDKAKELDGSYGGFQPKPAWENVIVCMKPLSEKTYVDQALKNGKGITWFDDCRIPFQGEDDYPGWWESGAKGSDGYLGTDTFKIRDMSAEEIKSRQFKKTDYDKYVEKQKSFKGAKTIGVVNEGGNTFLGGDMKQLDPSETYLKKTTKRKPRPDDSTWAESGFKSEDNDTAEASPMGRFPANLLVQDDVLNDGLFRQPSGNKGISNRNSSFGSSLPNQTFKPQLYNDGQSFSRYYDLDAWWEERIKELPLNVQATYPFIIVPKASKAEKNKGCDGLEDKQGNRNLITSKFVKRGHPEKGKPVWSENKGSSHSLPTKNNHPTVKPISLMSYLITLGSREDDLVLDPFVGSGTTCIAAKLLNRKYIGMEMDSDYVVIAQERIKAHEPERQQHDFF